VVGPKSSFDTFSKIFLRSIANFPPPIDGRNLKFLETKLDHKSVLDWASAESGLEGNLYLLFDTPNIHITKLLVFDGEEDSEEFINELRTIDSSGHSSFAIFKRKMEDCRINLFYKPWLTTPYMFQVFSSFSIFKATIDALERADPLSQDPNKHLKATQAAFQKLNLPINKDVEALQESNLQINKDLKASEDRLAMMEVMLRKT
jgi:hypothetical protein